MKIKLLLLCATVVSASPFCDRFDFLFESESQQRQALTSLLLLTYNKYKGAKI